jgi:hypothetical protein
MWTIVDGDEAQFHRHIAVWDDCVNWRLPPDSPVITCTVENLENRLFASL